MTEPTGEITPYTPETQRNKVNAAQFTKFLENTLLDSSNTVELPRDPANSGVVAEMHYTANKIQGPNRDTDIHVIQTFNPRKIFDTSYIVTRGDKQYTFHPEGKTATAMLRERKGDEYKEKNLSEADFSELQTQIENALVDGSPTERLEEIPLLARDLRESIHDTFFKGAAEAKRALDKALSQRRYISPPPISLQLDGKRTRKALTAALEKGRATPAQIRDSREITKTLSALLKVEYLNDPTTTTAHINELAKAGVWTVEELQAYAMDLTKPGDKQPATDAVAADRAAIEVGQEQVTPSEFADFLHNTLRNPDYTVDISHAPADTGIRAELHYAAGHTSNPNIHIVQPFFSDRTDEIAYAVTRGDETYMIREGRNLGDAMRATVIRADGTIEEIDNLAVVQAQVTDALQNGQAIERPTNLPPLNPALKIPLFEAMPHTTYFFGLDRQAINSFNAAIGEAIRNGAKPEQIRRDPDISSFLSRSLQGALTTMCQLRLIASVDLQQVVFGSKRSS